MVTANVNPDAEFEVGSITGLSFDNEKFYIFGGDGGRLYKAA